MGTDQKPELFEISDRGEGATRRDLLLTIGKWSKAVVGGVIAGGALARSAAAWVNRRQGIVRRGTSASGPGGTWLNRRGVGAWPNKK